MAFTSDYSQCRGIDIAANPLFSMILELVGVHE